MQFFGAINISLAALVAATNVVCAQAPARNERLSSALAQGRVAGTILRRSKENYVFIPRSGELPEIAVENSDQVAAGALGLPVTVKGRLTEDVQRLTIDNIEFDLGTLPAPGERLNPVVASIERELQDFNERANSALKPGGLGDERDAVSKAAKQTIDEIEKICTTRAVEADKARIKNPGGHAAAARAINLLRAKTRFGNYDVWPVMSYPRIFRNAERSVALSFGAGAIHCSGALVKPDVVLTAAHCLRDPTSGKVGDWTQMRAWFNYFDKTVNKEKDVPVLGLVAPKVLTSALSNAIQDESLFNHEVLDYVFLRIKGDEIPKELLSDRDFEKYGQSLCKNLKSNRGQALYVVGYGDGDRGQVYDNTRLFLPRQLSADDHKKFMCEIGPSLVPLVESQRISQTDFTGLVERLAAAYEPNPKPSGLFDQYLLFHPFYGGMPAIGIDPDTVGGASGGPVYDRNGHCIAAVFVGGQNNEVSVPAASWYFHEIALPIQDIHKQLMSDPDPDIKALAESFKFEAN